MVFNLFALVWMFGVVDLPSDDSFKQVSGIRYQVSGIRYAVSGIRYKVSAW